MPDDKILRLLRASNLQKSIPAKSLYLLGIIQYLKVVTDQTIWVRKCNSAILCSAQLDGFIECNWVSTGIPVAKAVITSMWFCSFQACMVHCSTARISRDRNWTRKAMAKLQLETHFRLVAIYVLKELYVFGSHVEDACVIKRGFQWNTHWSADMTMIFKCMGLPSHSICWFQGMLSHPACELSLK